MDSSKASEMASSLRQKAKHVVLVPNNRDCPLTDPHDDATDSNASIDSSLYMCVKPTEPTTFLEKPSKSGNAWSKEAIVIQISEHDQDTSTQESSQASDSECSCADYWASHLNDSSACSFPTIDGQDDKARNSLQICINREQLSALCESQQTTVLAAVQTAWALILQGYTLADDVCFWYHETGPKVLNRSLICRARLDRHETFGEIMNALHESNRNAMQNLDIRHHELVQILKEHRTEANTMVSIKYSQTSNNRISNDYPLTLQCDMAGATRPLTLSYNSTLLSEAAAQRLGRSCEKVLLAMIQDEATVVSSFHVVSEDDLDLETFRRLPEPTESCTHWLINEQIMQRPQEEAVCAWDGSLTYQELGVRSSQLASGLQARGIGPGTFLAFCFPKGIEAVVAMVAIHMAGAAFVTLDLKAPTARWESILQSIQVTGALCDAGLTTRFEGLVAKTLTVEDVLRGTGSAANIDGALVSVSPSDPSCVLFTSGSTGRPKGIVMEHQTLCSLSNGHPKHLGVEPGSRVFQFSSFSFDAGVMEVLLTLIRGGCVCLPSEDERMNNISGAMTRLKANWAFLTPTIADTLEPQDVPHLRTLAVGGEPPSPQLVDRWKDEVSLHEVYGPTEVAICASNDELGFGLEASCLGSPISSAFWIVDPQKTKRLVPDGVIGELLIQGPLLARGYVSADENAMSNWINDTERLPRGVPKSRAYRTGDLVRRRSNGTFDFIGRKDSQVKIRGQRTELGEIESLLNSLLPEGMRGAVAVIPGKDRTLDSLVALLWFSEGPYRALTPVRALDQLSNELASLIATIDGALRAALPVYMIPSTYPIFQGVLEQTHSAKVERRKLVSLGQDMSTSERQRFAPLAKEHEEPKTEMELQLRDMWASLLHLPAEAIGKQDNFFHMGGDSVSSIRLAKQCQLAQVWLSVADIFENPTLAAMALAASSRAVVQDNEQVQPFSLIPDDEQASILQDTRSLCGLGSDEEVEDVYPCTSLQQGLMAIGAQSPGAYIARYVYRLRDGMDLPRFKAAWEETVKACEVLRTRIVTLSDGKSVQAVIKGDTTWDIVETVGLDAAAQSWRNVKMTYGSRLCRFAIVQEEGKYYFIWVLHHAVYDGWTKSLVLDTLKRSYEASQQLILPRFSGFISYVNALDTAACDAYWAEKLAGAQAATYPVPRSQARQSSVTINNYRSTVSLRRPADLAVTRAAVVEAAWSIILARYSESSDICFGKTISGRHAPVSLIDEIAGPTIATVPVRVRLDPDSKVSDFLEDTQLEALKSVPYEQAGLQNIARLGPGPENACSFSSLLVIQLAEMMDGDKEEDGAILIAGPTEEALTEESVGNYYGLPLVLQAVLREDAVELVFLYDPESVRPLECQAISQQMAHVMSQLIEQPHATLASVAVGGDWDLDQARTWNGEPSIQCHDHLDDLVVAMSEQRPNAEAIHSEKGSLSYKDLVASARRLANHLHHLGIAPGSVVPLCFEQSQWVISAMLGVSMAGCSFVPLDPSHPQERQREVVSEVDATIIVASSSAVESCSSFAHHVVDLEALLSDEESTPTDVIPKEQSQGQVAYVLFTSGSTGKPKGVVVEHGAVCTSLLSYITKHGLDESTRLLQIASYTFDASIFEIFLSLLCGGTICIPSKTSRQGDLANSIAAARVNTAFLTPSFVKLLEPAQVPTLRQLVLMGEAPTEDVISKWQSHVQLINGYGPTEASICCCSYEYNAENSSNPHRTVGSKTHGNCWIVEPFDHNRVCPIGCIGELVVEGPALARGYLNDDSKTAVSFLDNVAWLPSSSNRFYKTGDLVRYNADGTMEYHGRKDAQVKLRGRRLELGEIEYNIQAASSVIRHAAVLLSSRTSGQFLVAFFESALGDVDQEAEDGVVTLTQGTSMIIRQVNEYLRSRLPSYMLPAFYLPISQMPFVTSTKTDRKSLQGLADGMTIDKMSLYSPEAEEKVEPATAAEVQLQSLWAKVLSVRPGTIGRHDRFLHVGGDSISAIQLSALARQEGLHIPVPVIFEDDRLSAIAKASRSFDDSEASPEGPPARFSLLKNEDIPQVVAQLRDECKLASSEVVQDAYPCTPLQEGLLALSVKNPGSYIAKFVYRLGRNIDLDRFKAAWEHVYDISENQRLRVVKLGDASIQTLVGGDFAWEPTEGMSLTQYLGIAQDAKMSYGTKLCRSALIDDPNGNRYLVWVIHHAMFDGWNVMLLFDALRQAYKSGKARPFSPYSSFVKYASSLDMDAVREYWKLQLSNAPPTEFPPQAQLQSSRNEKVTELISHEISFPSRMSSSITKGTILRAAWAVVLARYGNTDDVVFGATASGRNAPVPGIERMAGTVIGTVPVRIKIDRKKPLSEFLQDVQAQALNMVPYEQTGFQNIAKINAETRQGCQVTSLLIVQPERQMQGMSDAAAEIMERASESEYSFQDTVEGYFTFPIAFQCLVYKDHVMLDFTYDSSVVPRYRMEALCHHFETVVQQLLTQDSRTVGDVTLASDWDVERAVEVNSHIVETVEHSCVHELISRWAPVQPDAEAIFSTERSMSFAELDRLSTELAGNLNSAGVRLESVIPLCFEKSIWTIVAMLGVMKAGAVFMPMDPSHPRSRREDLIQQVDAKFLITSPSVTPSCEGLVPNIMQLSSEQPAGSSMATGATADIQKPSPSNAAYILFTSGSTGKPKGIVVEHTAISSSIVSHGKEFGLGTSSRVLQFASYAFDVSVSEILTTLVFGGTVCVPTATERMQDIASFINRCRADTAMLTPSFVTTFSPDQVPGLRCLILGGEAPTKNTLTTWQPHVRLLNGYAPAECCIYALTHDYEAVGELPTVLGKGMHSYCYVVDPDDHSRLAPFGCVGELIIHSNAIGRGYVNDETKTKQAFLPSIPGLSVNLQRPHFQFYKSGDLVRYDENGAIDYLGRKDTQVKLRGQRIELGEIEHNAKELLPEASHVAVEVIRKNGREALVLFASFLEDGKVTDTVESDELMLPLNSTIRRLFQSLTESLEAKLPPYMVPSLFVPLKRMPFLSSMKVDRRQLRSVVDELSPQGYARLSLADAHGTSPSTEEEMLLRDLWADVLLIERDHIMVEDNFFQVGGDSLAALQLVSLAQKQGLALDVASIFNGPELASMAKRLTRNTAEVVSVSPKPLQLLPEDVKADILRDAQHQCRLDTREDIEDILPCTSLQESMIALSTRQPGAYVSSSIYRVPDGIELGRFRSAWEKTVEMCSNLRTRFFVPRSSASGKPVQVLVAGRSCEWEQTADLSLKAYLQRADLKAMGSGTPLCRFALLQEGNDKGTYFILTMHHSIYDMWSLHLVLETLQNAYGDRPLQGLEPYSGFVRYSLDCSLEHNEDFWSTELAGSRKTLYPRPRPADDAKPSSMKVFYASIPCPDAGNSSITMATILQAAWAIVLSRYCKDDDVCFGSTVSGRLAAVPGLSRMAGPTISTIPIRLRLNSQQTVSEFLEYVQAHGSSLISHEQYGLQNISRTSTEARAACEISNLLVIQPLHQVSLLTGDGPAILEELQTTDAIDVLQEELQSYFSYPLVMNLIVADHDVKVHAYYDANLLSPAELETLHQDLSRIVQQLQTRQNLPLSSFIGQADRSKTFDSPDHDYEQTEIKMKAVLPAGVSGMVTLLREDMTSLYHLTALLWCDEIGQRNVQSPSLGICDEVPPALEQSLRQAHSSLAISLPAHLVPSHYIFLQNPPSVGNPSSISRRDLVEFATAVASEERIPFDQQENETRQPLSNMEFRLRDLWSLVLGIPSSRISRNDSFLRIGGDSISAIQLVSLARHRGLSMQVSSVFKDSRLSQMAATVFDVESESEASIEPFALIQNGMSDSTLGEIRQQCHLQSSDEVEDAYPCTPLQEGLLALGVKLPRSYIARYVFKLGEDISVDSVMAACRHTVEMSANLRTRIVILDNKPTQVVVRGSGDLEEVPSLGIKAFMDQEPTWTMGYGDALSRLTLVSGRYLVWAVHHAVTDGWTFGIIMDRLRRAYHQLPQLEVGSFAYFVKQSLETNHKAAQTYWDEQLAGAKRMPFPSQASAAQDTTTASFKKSSPLMKMVDPAVTTATVFRAAWALVMAKYTGSRDVCFGTTVSGRQAPIEGLETISGPTIATVPVRIKTDEALSVSGFLASVQEQALDMVPHEQFGLQNIAKANRSAQEACDFSSLLVIQPNQAQQDDGAAAVMELADEAEHGTDDLANGYYSYPMVFEIQIFDGHVEFTVAYSTASLSEYRVEALTCHLLRVAEQLIRQDYQTLGDVEVAGEWDLNQAIEANCDDLSPVDLCLHDMIAAKAAATPDKEAVYATERSLSYAELDSTSLLLATHLQKLGVQAETVVPFCFEKSVWAVVAILGILKAGGAFMPLDPAHPRSYRDSLIEKVDANVVIVSPTTGPIFGEAGSKLIELGPNSPFLNETSSPLLAVRSRPSNAAYILFSSGSTGSPKGIVVEHAQFASSSVGQSTRFGLDNQSRVLQWCNFVFDVSVAEIITTLCQGATVCMPSETERLHDTASFISQSGCDIAFMTPSFARTLHPDQVPGLRKLLVGGEAVTSDIVETWANSRSLVNAYGPAECSVFSASFDFPSSNIAAATIGRGIKSSTWVIDLDKPDRLAPIGSIGELVLQSPAVARGYFKDPQRTAQSFTSNLDSLPPGIVRQCPRFFKTGDLVRQELGGLVYIGRRDAQVKLRGQRIDLGDIEYRAQCASSLIDRAMIDVVMKNSVEMMVAFIKLTGQDHDHEEGASFQPSTEARRLLFRSISSTLSTEVPAHMVPTHWIEMPHIPQTSSGKVNRRVIRKAAEALPMDEFVSYAVSQRRAFREPSNSTESRLRLLWSQTLGIEEQTISVDDNFYGMGGDSIRIVTLMKLIRDTFSVQLGLSMLNSRNTTISAMASTIESFGADMPANVDLSEEIRSLTATSWLASLDDSSFQSATTLGNHATVFLTGASGFLGTQLLRQLIDMPDVDCVITLVRSVSASQGMGRVKRTATIAGWWEDGSDKKIEVWTGDLGESRLGITDSQWERLCGRSATGNVDAIIHNGAIVNWNADYDTLRPANVQSSLDLLRAAVDSPCAPKMVFVSGGTDNDVRDNDPATMKTMAESIGYSQTKFVAERVIHHVAERTGSAQNRFSTVKPGIVLGTSQEGVANLDDFIWRMVAAAARVQCYPLASADAWITMNDAGTVATGIINQVLQDRIAPYVSEQAGIPCSTFWEQVNSVLPQACSPVSWEVWKTRALDDMNEMGESHCLWPVQQFLGPLGTSQTTSRESSINATVCAAVRSNVQYLLRVGYIKDWNSAIPNGLCSNIIQRSNNRPLAP